MGDGKIAHGFVGVSEAAEFIGKRLAGLVLETIGVHRVETEAKAGRLLLQRRRVRRFIPGEMQ